MFNKKFGLMVLSAAVLGLAACGNNGGNTSKESSEAKPSEPATSSAESKEQSSGELVIPVADGMTTVYFELAAPSTETGKESVAIPEGNSPFMTGGFCDWKTGMDGEKKPAEFTKLGESSIWYTMIPADSYTVGDDATAVASRGFQITLGWNADSNAAAKNQGIDWAYKSDLSKLFPGSSHPKFSNPVNNLVKITSTDAVVEDPLFPDVNSDDHWMVNPDVTIDTLRFEKAKPAPQAIENYDVKFTIKNYATYEGLSERKFYIVGGFNNWQNCEFPGEGKVGAEKLEFDATGVAHYVFHNQYSEVEFEYQIIADFDLTNFWADANKAQKSNFKLTPLGALAEVGDEVELDFLGGVDPVAAE